MCFIKMFSSITPYFLQAGICIQTQQPTDGMEKPKKGTILDCNKALIAFTIVYTVRAKLPEIRTRYEREIGRNRVDLPARKQCVIHDTSMAGCWCLNTGKPYVCSARPRQYWREITLEYHCAGNTLVSDDMGREIVTWPL